MDVIEKIIAGHRDIHEREDVFGKLAKLIDQDAFFWDNAAKVLEFFETEMLQHFELEEKVLFPVLKKAVPENEGKTIAGLEAEHGPMRRMIEEFKKAAQAHIHSSSRVTREQMAGIAREIIETSLPHARREDELLFPLIRQYFVTEHYRELEDRYFEYLGV